MHSIVKIFSDELTNRQSKIFSYTVKGYEKVQGILVCGQGEISLVFNKNSRVTLNSFDVNTGKDVEPDKRVLILKKNLKDEFIKGSVKKTKADGRLSVYLIVE